MVILPHFIYTLFILCGQDTKQAAAAAAAIIIMIIIRTLFSCRSSTTNLLHFIHQEPSHIHQIQHNRTIPCFSQSHQIVVLRDHMCCWFGKVEGEGGLIAGAQIRNVENERRWKVI